MVVFKVKELMEAKNITRYKLQKDTNWNYKRINAFFFNNVKKITLEEIEILCKIFECEIHDLMEIKHEK